MRDKKEISIEEIHKEIDLIQSCITRMAQNSFMIKGWFVSIYAVILALLPEKINLLLLCIALTAVNLIFWYLDGFFLRTEKVYRKIYDWVLEMRPQNNRELMYQLNLVNATIIATLKKRKSFCFVKSPFILSFITPPRFSRAVWYQSRATVLQRQGVSAPHPHARTNLEAGIVHSPSHEVASGCSRRPCRYRKIQGSALFR